MDVNRCESKDECRATCHESRRMNWHGAPGGKAEETVRAGAALLRPIRPAIVEPAQGVGDDREA